MNIARNTAEWVLTDSPPRAPTGLGGSRIITQQVYQAPPSQVYRVPHPLVFADLPQESTMNISAQEWVPPPPPTVRRTHLDVSMDEAMRNLRHAFACAEHAKKIAHDAAIVAQDATNAAQIAKEAALSASESVERAANIVRELYQVALPVPSAAASGATASVAAASAATSTAASVAASGAAPAPAPVLIRAVPVNALPTLPIVAGGKVRHGAKFCFRKQKGRECKLVGGKCKWCK